MHWPWEDKAGLISSHWRDGPGSVTNPNEARETQGLGTFSPEPSHTLNLSEEISITSEKWIAV